MKRTHLIIIAGAGAALAACQTPAVVAAPTPVSCVPKALGPAPKYAASRADLLAATPGERHTLAVGGFIERDQRLSEVEPVIEKCRLAGSGN